MPSITENKRLMGQIMWMLTHNVEFCGEYGNRIRPEFFGSPSERYLVEVALDYYRENGTVLRRVALDHRLELDETNGRLDRERLDERSITRLYERLIEVEDGDEDALFKEAGRFTQHQTLNLGLRRVQQLLDDEGIDPALQELERVKGRVAIPVARTLDFMGDMDSALGRIGIQALEKIIPTGLPKLDHAMGGGLSHGEVAVFLAPTGRGKTMWLCQCAAQAMGRGITVVYYTLEVGQDEVFTRILSSATGTPIDDILDYSAYRNDPEFRDQFEPKVEKPSRIRGRVVPKRKNRSPLEAIAAYRERLALSGGDEATIIIRDITDKAASLDGLVADFRRIQTEGHEPKLMVIDYADRLRPHGRYERRYEGQEEVYQELQALSKELNVGIWTAAQVGRDGLRTNVLTLDKVQGSFNKLFETSFVIAAGQDDAMRAHDEFVFFMAKTRRGGSAGKGFYVKYNFAKALFLASERGLPDTDFDLAMETQEAMSYQRDWDDDEEEDLEPKKSKRAYFERV